VTDGRVNGIRQRVAPAVPALVAFAPVVVLAGAQGGYFRTAWGWAAVPLLWTAASALVVRERVRLSRAEGLFLGGLVAFAAWTAASALWSAAPALSLVETERTLVYVGAGVALLVTARTRSSRVVLGALLAAICLIAVFSLATRLLPDRVGVFDGTGVYRLAQPIGYWNGLAIFVAMGVLLGLGFAARARTIVARSTSAAALVLLVPTLYFTFGRGAWIALGVGLAAMLVADPGRLQLLATLVVVAPAPAVAVLVASREQGLTHGGTSLATAAHDGHRVAVVLAFLALVNVLVAVGLELARRRVRVGDVPRRVFAGAVTVALVGAAAAGLVHFGGPVQMVRTAYAAFKVPLPKAQGNLNKRLLSFSGNGRAQLWGIAWDDARAHPFLGAGAGTFERYFLVHQPADVSRVRDAHSLYVETLAELGPIGAALLVVVLATPLAALRRARRHPLAPAAAGAYVAYLVHTGVDWDWELPAVTLAGLMCGAAILLMARRSAPSLLGARLRWTLAGLGVVTALVCTTATIGNTELSRSAADRDRGAWAPAVQAARRAHVLMPWSPAPWQALGQAQLAAGLVPDARLSFRKAISIDHGDWNLWYELSRVASGRERSLALRRVAELFPRSGLGAKETPGS
jgi:hypothetical protein